MADEKAKIIIDGDVSPLRQKLREAARELKQFGEEGAASISGLAAPLKLLQEKFIAIGALLAGGAVFKQAVEQASRFTEEAIRLGNALGISATQASGFILALEDIGVSHQEFSAAAKALSREIKNNEATLRSMGLVTRDASGNLRPLNELVVEAIDLLNSYKAGTDRAIAGQMLFGKSFDISSNLMRLNGELLRENIQLQERLGFVVGKENVEAWKAYDQAADQATITLKALWAAIGNAIMPVLTKLSEWFVSVGPAAMTVVRGAIGGLTAAFWSLKNGVVVVWETINAMVVTVAEPLRALAEAIYRAGTGDFHGAGKALGNIAENIKNAWKGALAEIEKSSIETRDRIWALFAPSSRAEAQTGGRSAAGLIKQPEAGKTPAARTKPRFTDAEWANIEAEHLRKTLDEIARIEQEYQDAREAAQRKADEKLLKDITDIYMLRVEAAKSAEMDRIDALESAARHELELGVITQQEYLARLAEFNEMRLSAEERFIAAKRQIAEEDPEQNVVELERLEIEKAEIRRRYREKDLELQRQMALETRKIWSDLGDRISGLWDKGINALINGTLTFRSALRAIFAEIVGWFAKEVVGNMVKTWLAAEIKKLMIKIGLIQQEKAIEKAGAAQTVATKMSEATAVATANAVEAGTGAAASQAAIPIVGPALALAAMAAVFAAVMALAGKIKSAARGYDIPKGINPITQLHEEEMVLPQKYANLIRSMAENEAQPMASGQTINLHVSAVDAASVRRLFLENRVALADALKAAARDFKR